MTPHSPRLEQVDRANEIVDALPPVYHPLIRVRRSWREANTELFGAGCFCAGAALVLFIWLLSTL